MNSTIAVGERLLLCAAVIAIAHAVPVPYWAFGGTLGMDSLGTWAPAWRAERPVVVAVVLVGVFRGPSPGQGNDIGSQYRSAIFTNSEDSLAAAMASRDTYQAKLSDGGYGEPTPRSGH